MNGTTSLTRQKRCYFSIRKGKKPHDFSSLPADILLTIKRKKKHFTKHISDCKRVSAKCCFCKVYSIYKCIYYIQCYIGIQKYTQPYNILLCIR